MSFRKQSQFAGIARVMARHRGQSIRVRGARYHSGAAGAPAAGAVEPPKLAVVERDGVRIDLNEAITEASFGSDPTTTGKKLSLAIEAIRQQLVLAVNSGWGKEAFDKATADLQAVILKYETSIKEYRAALNPTPDPGYAEGRMKKSALAMIQLREDPRAPIEAKDEVVGKTVMAMSRAHYNVICSDVGSFRKMGCDDPIVLRKIERLQQCHDNIALWSEYVSKKDVSGFFSRGGWKAHPLAAEYEALASEIGQGIRETRLVGPAINETNPDEGKNWVPGPMLSGRILPIIEEEIALPNAFESIPMPGMEYEIGVQGTHLKSKKLLENLLDDGSTAGAKIVPTAWVSKKFKFTAKHHAAAVVVTPAWLQDAIVQTEFILRELAYSIARGREDWLLNGQLTSALDLVAIGADDIRKMGDGLRWMYREMRTAGIMVDVDAGAGLTAEAFTQVFGQQRSYGTMARRYVWACNVRTIAQILVLKTAAGQNVVLTEDITGGRGSFRTGEVAKIFGRGIFPVNDFSDKLNATGIEPAAPGDRSAILGIMTDAVKFGNRLGIGIEFSPHYRFLEYQDVFRAVARDDIQNGYAVATEPFIGQIVNIPG